MAASLAARPLLPPPPSSAPHRPLLLASRFLSPGALLGTKRSPLLSNGFKLRTGPSRRLVPVASAQPGWLRVIQTAWKVGKDGIEAGANLVPDTIPKPVARICVAAVAGTVFLFLVKSLLSTAFFVLALMGFVYFVYIALNTSESSRGGGSTTSTEEETLEEARRIMEKYK